MTEKEKRVKTLEEVIEFVIVASKFVDYDNLNLLQRVVEIKQDLESDDLTERPSIIKAE